MSYYCFNTDCNKWGEPQSMFMLACDPPILLSHCSECKGKLHFHDTWSGEVRKDDYGVVITK